jgi:serine/threonine protein kinase
MTETVVAKEGWAKKREGFIKRWKTYWFSLRGSVLVCSKKPGCKEKIRIEIGRAEAIGTAPECRKQPAFKIHVPGKKVLYIVTNTKKENQEWIRALEQIKSQKETPHAVKISQADFDILRVIGRGTYGKVQLVKSHMDDKLYAMKTMSKRLLSEHEQIEQTLTERNVLLQVEHPFMVRAHCSFQSATKVFMILDYVPGGELFQRLREEGVFSESRTQLYAAEILLSLGYLHRMGLVYRDLKPENILVDADGHIRITDFGLVKPKMESSKSTTSTFCGTPEYVAPEMLVGKPYTKSVDWWSFGILVFEMLVGIPPFYNENTNAMYKSILYDDLTFPTSVSSVAQDLITRLLNRNPWSRLGASDEDYKEIQRHHFFDGCNWDDISNKSVDPEWKPVLRAEADTSNFDREFTAEQPAVSLEDGSLIAETTQNAFAGFTCLPESILRHKS